MQEKNTKKNIIRGELDKKEYKSAVERLRISPPGFVNIPRLGFL